MIAFSGFVAVRRPAPVRPLQQRPLQRAAAARSDDRRLHRRHVLQGQERLVLDHVPAAAGPAHLRPDAAVHGRQRALPAVRRLRQELLRLQPARRLPGRPQRRRQLLERLPALLRRRLPGPRARLLRGPERQQPGDPRRDGALRRRQHRLVRAPERLRQDQHAHDHRALRRDRLQHLLLVRRRLLRPAGGRLDRPRGRDRPRRHLVRAHDRQGEAVPRARHRRARTRRRPGPARRRSHGRAHPQRHRAPSPAAPPRSPSSRTTSASRPSRG